MDKVNKIEGLKENKEFIAKLELANTIDGFIKAFADEGIEVSEEEIMAAGELLNSDGELNERALECVTGGVWWHIPLAVAGIMAASSAAKGFFKAMQCK